MNSLWVRSIIYPRKKAVDSGDRVEEWGLFSTVLSIVVRDHSRPASTGKQLAL